MGIPLLIVDGSGIFYFFHIPRPRRLDMMKSTLLERLIHLSAAFLSTASTLFWGSEPNKQDWSGVPNLSRDKLKNNQRGDDLRRSRESFACEKSRCSAFGRIIFFDTRSTQLSPGDLGL
jgi:hypothetical protein